MGNLINTFSSYKAIESAFNRASSFFDVTYLDTAVENLFQGNWNPTSVERTVYSAKNSQGDTLTMYGLFNNQYFRINKILATGSNGVKLVLTGNITIYADESYEGSLTSIIISLGPKQVALFGEIDLDALSYNLNKIKLSNGADSVTLMGNLTLNNTGLGGTLTQMTLKSGQQSMTLSGFNYQLTGVEQTVDRSFLLSLLTGNDVIQGGAGNDLLDGGAGADQMNGMKGNDTYYVDNVGDIIIDSAGLDKVVIRTLSQYSLADYLENLSAEGVSNFILNGNAKPNNITGSSGNDRLDGYAGVDTLSGGTGDDLYYVDTSKDSVIEKAFAGVDSINSSVPYTLPANVENLTYVGTVGAKLTGNTSANMIVGGVNSDTISGGKGSDTLTGGLGADVFKFNTGDSGQTNNFDVIQDFQKGVDIIDYNAKLTVGGANIIATSALASINQTNAVATFTAGSGLSLDDALIDIASGFTAAKNSKGEFALFQLNNSGNYYLYISDGVAGITANDVVIQLQGVTSISSIDLTNGNLILSNVV